MIADDDDNVATCTRAIAALNCGNADGARELMIKALIEHRDLLDDHDRLSRRAAEQRARLSEIANLCRKPLEAQ